MTDSLPTVSMGEDYLNSMTEPDPKLKPGWYRAMVVRENQKVSKTEKMTLMFELILNCLKDENDASSADPRASVFDYLCMPFEHPNRPPPADVEEQDKREKAARGTRDMCENKLRAILGTEEIPARPKMENNELCYQGSSIPPDQKNVVISEIRATVVAKAAELWNNRDGQQLRDGAPYVEIHYQEGRDNPSIKRMAHELPKGATLVPVDQWWDG